MKCPGSGGAASKAVKYWVETRTAAITKQKAGNCRGDKPLLVAIAGTAQTQNLDVLISVQHTADKQMERNHGAFNCGP